MNLTFLKSLKRSTTKLGDLGAGGSSLNSNLKGELLTSESESLLGGIGCCSVKGDRWGLDLWFLARGWRFPKLSWTSSRSFGKFLALMGLVPSETTLLILAGRMLRSSIELEMLRDSCSRMLSILGLLLSSVSVFLLFLVVR